MPCVLKICMSNSRCLFPVRLKKTDVVVPCGRCLHCRKRYVSNWSFRLMQEEKVCDSATFLTLTYDSDHVPLTRNGFMSLKKRDLQLFFKRLRKAHVGKYKGRRIKYYAVGEYGGRTRRPHYHIILFNADVELVQRNWTNGSFYCGEVGGASVGYTLKYLAKPKWKPMHKNDDRAPQFSLMSKGLGISYLEEKKTSIGI